MEVLPITIDEDGQPHLKNGRSAFLEACKKLGPGEVDCILLKRDEKPKGAVLKALQDEWFEKHFWPHCWIKSGKAPAKDKAWPKVALTEEQAIFIGQRAKRQTEIYKADPTSKMKYPQGWLSDRRFEDECLNERPKSSAVLETPEQRNARLGY